MQSMDRDEYGRFIVGSKINKRYNKYNLDGEYGIGHTLKGVEFYFDLEDYNKIKMYCWSYCRNYLVARDCENNKVIRLQNLIMGTNNVVDHSDRNTLDNRKLNLRECTQSQNSKNQSQPKNSKCEFMGISKRKNKEVYEVRIGYNKKKTHIG